MSSDKRQRVIKHKRGRLASERRKKPRPRPFPPRSHRQAPKKRP